MKITMGFSRTDNRFARVGFMLIALLLFSSIARAGTFASTANLSFDPAVSSSNLDQTNAASEFVGGADVTFDWALIEQTPGNLDFTVVDAKIKTWADQNKKFVVVIRYLNEKAADCSKGQRIPSWELAKIGSFCDSNWKVVIPDYFDHGFKADLKNFIAAVGDHIAKSEYKNRVLYVRGGVGLGSEGFYLTPCNLNKNPTCDESENLGKLKAWGFTPGVWKRWQMEMLNTYQQNFPNNVIIYPLVNLGVDPDTGRTVQMDVANWAASRGMGVGALGLGPNFANGPAQIGTIMSTVRSRYPNAYLQLQTVSTVGDVDTLSADIALAIQLNVQFVEWYASDLMNSAYQDSFKGFAAAVGRAFDKYP